MVNLSMFILSAIALMLTSILLTADSILRRAARHGLINRIAARVLRQQLEQRMTRQGEDL
jgi:hypothetical protein